MKKHIFTTYLAFLAFTGVSLISAKTVTVFDIHGVLLHENIAGLVEAKIAALLAQPRGLAHNGTFQELAELMTVYKPLGTPVASYKQELGIPYEVYALFAGIHTPDFIHKAIMTMLDEILLIPRKKAIYTALIETVFDHAARVSALTPIPGGIALFKACLACPDMEVFIYTNAPTEWVAQYKTLFPEIFNGIADDHILASGSTGLVKPDAAVFELICQRANCTVDQLLLIDDSTHNTAAISAAGGHGLLFN